ncbi:MAG TPA: 3-phosphoshikimate 1-carboxyvinyltransferase [Phycisphaerales bacterium]|nr:3-phosphoshikimate 1-carboxyvinyltransferase [Phycisphaerales bacterium]
MDLIVEKSVLKGQVIIPGSKSHTIRAVMVASLANGSSTIRSPLASEDTLSAVRCCRGLGAMIDTNQADAWQVQGTGGQVAAPQGLLDAGNSGTTLNLAMSLAALGRPGEMIELTGDEQVRRRPVGPLIDSLRDLGASAESIKGNGCPPVRVSGRLTGGRTRIACPTSQYLSSLLMACPLAQGDSDIEVTVLNEPDYVQMTMDWLDSQQITYENQGMHRFHIQGGQAYRPFDTAIPADFSSATFFLCGATLLPGSDVMITGLDFSDSQPDKAVVDYLRRMGADIQQGEEGVRVRSRPLQGATIDMNRTPDALPAMAVTAVFAHGPTQLVNVPQARTKETDRIACMAKELRKFGVGVEEFPDGLVINPTKSLRAAPVEGHGDHRIVMALSLAGMAIDGGTRIRGAEAMNVTFPTFLELMCDLGASMKTAS